MQEDLLLRPAFFEVSLNYDKMSKFKGTDNPNMWSILLNSRKDGRNKRKKLLKKKKKSKKYKV